MVLIIKKLCPNCNTMNLILQDTKKKLIKCKNCKRNFNLEELKGL